MWKCPECGSMRLKVVVEVECNLIQEEDGNFQTEERDCNHEWSENSVMACRDCGEQNIADKFDVEVAKEYPAIYLLDPIGVDGALEANGTVFVYCSEACRVTAITERGVESDPPHKLGTSADWADGAVCDECHVAL